MIARSAKQAPLPIVGSTKFGRYPKISVEQTFNMIISDEWQVDYAGYETSAVINPDGEGRGAYASKKYGRIIMVIDDNVLTADVPDSSDEDIEVTKIASLSSSTGDVTITENITGQIAICDKKNIYIFDYLRDVFYIAKGNATDDIDFVPGYIEYQNGNFISVDLRASQWRLSYFNPDNDRFEFRNDAPYVGEFQTKADNPVAAIRVPGKGNLLYVMGSDVTEAWFNTGLQLFPYDKNTYMNFDFGVVNSASIATNDQMVVWLGRNEISGPAIMVSTGGAPEQISTDGINYKLAQLTRPQDCYAFFIKQDGHLLYQITFYTDNLSYVYDFNTKLFFSLSDENMNCHIAKKVVFFKENYYFVSIKDGNLYRMSSSITTYGSIDKITGEPIKNEIPRVRVLPTFSMPDSHPFTTTRINFIVEQGQGEEDGMERIDISFSKNGGRSFSNSRGYPMNAPAHFKNRINITKMGTSNSLTMQLRYWGMSRFTVSNGTMEYHQ